MLKDYDYSNRGHQGVEDRYFFAKGPEESRTHYIHFVEKNNNTYEIGISAESILHLILFYNKKFKISIKYDKINMVI